MNCFTRMRSRVRVPQSPPKSTRKRYVSGCFLVYSELFESKCGDCFLGDCNVTATEIFFDSSRISDISMCA